MAKSTETMYTRIISEFFEVIGVPWWEVEEKHLWEYTAFMRDKEGAISAFSNDKSFSPATMRKNLNAIRGFFSFLVKHKKRRDSPFWTFPLKFNPAKDPKKRFTDAVSFNDVKKILNYEFADSREGLRDKAILHILFNTGIRRTECAALSLCDVKTSEEGSYYLAIRKSKGSKYREAALADWAIPPILELKESRKKEGAKSIDPLLVCYDNFGRANAWHMSDKTVYVIFKRYAKLLGIKNKSPHSARRSVCTKLLSDGVNPRDVQEVLGHSTPHMVEVYDKRRKTVENSAAKNLSY